MRDLQADLEEWNSDLINGTRSADWFYLVTEYIERAIKAEEQAVALKEGLERIKTNIEEYHPHNTLALPKFRFAKELHNIAIQALAELETKPEPFKPSSYKDSVY